MKLENLLIGALVTRYIENTALRKDHLIEMKFNTPNNTDERFI